MEVCSKYDGEHEFDFILGYVILCLKLRWICREHSNYVVRQVETSCRATISVGRQIYLVARRNFHVALEVTLYHE